MRNVVLAGACRTPIGTMGGALSSKSAVELGSLVISEALNLGILLLPYLLLRTNEQRLS